MLGPFLVVVIDAPPSGPDGPFVLFVVLLHAPARPSRRRLHSRGRGNTLFARFVFRLQLRKAHLVLALRAQNQFARVDILDRKLAVTAGALNADHATPGGAKEKETAGAMACAGSAKSGDLLAVSLWLIRLPGARGSVKH
jgi:hypothetical protein